MLPLHPGSSESFFIVIISLIAILIFGLMLVAVFRIRGSEGRTIKRPEVNAYDEAPSTNTPKAVVSPLIEPTRAWVVGVHVPELSKIKSSLSIRLALSLVLLALALAIAGRNGFFPSIVRKVAVSGNYAYLAVEGQGLRILDISDPTQPKEVGSFHTVGNAYDLAVSQNTVYISDGEAGVSIIDTSNPARPVEVGSFDTPESAYSLAVSENTLYVADLDRGLRILDVSNPANPGEIGFYETEGLYARHVHIIGKSAYVFDLAGRMRIMDLSNPAHPVEVGWVDYLANPSELEVVGNYAYIAVAGSGLGIVDLSSATAPGVEGVSPNIVGYYYSPGPGSARGPEQGQAIALAGRLAYLADGPHGLRIIDISNPVDPRVVSTFDTPGSAYDVVVVGNTAYVADWDQGLRVIDISDPANPRELGYYQRRGLAGNMALVNYAQWLFTLAGVITALLVHWLSWLIRLRAPDVATGLGLVVFSILATLSLVFMFPDPGSGADGAYVMQALAIGVWAIVFPLALMIGTLQARSLLAPWWKGVLCLFFEAGLGLLMLAGLNYSQRWFMSMPDTGLSLGEYQTQFSLFFMISLIVMAVIRPIVRSSARRLPPVGHDQPTASS